MNGGSGRIGNKFLNYQYIQSNLLSGMPDVDMPSVKKTVRLGIKQVRNNEISAGLRKTVSMYLTNGHSEIIMVKSRGMRLYVIPADIIRIQYIILEDIGRFFERYLELVHESKKTKERKEAAWTVVRHITRKRKMDESAYLHCIPQSKTFVLGLLTGGSAGSLALPELQHCESQ